MGPEGLDRSDRLGWSSMVLVLGFILGKFIFWGYVCNRSRVLVGDELYVLWDVYELKYYGICRRGWICGQGWRSSAWALLCADHTILMSSILGASKTVLESGSFEEVYSSPYSIMPIAIAWLIEFVMHREIYLWSPVITYGSRSLHKFQDIRFVLASSRIIRKMKRNFLCRYVAFATISTKVVPMCIDFRIVPHPNKHPK